MRHKQGGSLTTEPLQHSVSQQEEEGALVPVQRSHTQAGPLWPFPPWTLIRMNSTTTQPPAHKDGGVPVSYVLVPFLLITIAGIATVLVSSSSECVTLELRKMQLSCTFYFVCSRFYVCVGNGGENKLRVLISWHCLLLPQCDPLISWCTLSSALGSTDFGISCYLFTRMTLQRSFMKLNRSFCGEKRTQG